MKVLITGSSGFIGSHLSLWLADRRYEVNTVVRTPGSGRGFPEYVWPAPDIAAMAAIIEHCRPEFIIHLAAQARPNRNINDFVAQYENTIRPTIAVATVVPSYVRLAVFFGSCEEYGDGPAPFDEYQPLRSISPYGWAKISAYHAVQSIFAVRNVPWCWVRPFLAFGPGQNGDRLVPGVINACLRNKDIPLSPGEQTRDFIFVHDLCIMIERILSKHERARHQVVNLCSGTPRSIRSVAELIQEKIGRGHLKLGALPYRQREAMRFYGSPNRFNELFGPVALCDFESAIEQTIQANVSEMAAGASKGQT